MKRLSCALLCAFLSFSSIQAQTGWFWQHPKPEGNNLNCVAVFGLDKAVSVGNIGFILRSADHGETWSKIPTGIVYNLNAVSIAQNGTGWAAGGGGTMLKTTDGGLTWVAQSTGKSNSVYALETTDGVKCLAGRYGGIFSVTNDGGLTWTNINTNSTKTIRSLCRDAGGNIYLAQDGGIIQKSQDGGATWTTLTTSITKALKDIAFQDATGYAVGEGGTLLKTTDAGLTWSQITVPSTYDLVSVVMTDINRIRVMDILGYFLVSTNAGATFTKTPATLDLGCEMYSFTLKANEYYVAVGEYAMVTKSTTGSDWDIKTEGFRQYLFDIWFTDAFHGYAVGHEGGIMKTTDGGDTWSVTSPSLWNPEFRSLFFLNSTTGFAGAGGLLYKTTNSGQTWTEVFSYESNPSLTSTVYYIFFIDQNYGWITTGDGKIYHSTDGGLSWGLQYNLGFGALSTIVFVDRQVGYAVGSNRTFLKTTNSGGTWTQVGATGEEYFSSLHVFDPSNMIVCAHGGKVFKTADGGNTWISVPLPRSITYSNFREMFFIDSNRGWLSGDGGDLLKTTDGGNTWSYLETNSTHDLLSLFFIDANTGWIGGSGGTVLKTIDGGGTSWIDMGEPLRSAFSIVQNFPNPFDRQTALTYFLPKSAPVKIEIFDVTGKKITTLLDRVAEAGTHQVVFDATGLPGGIYFCHYTWSGSEGMSVKLLKKQ